MSKRVASGEYSWATHLHHLIFSIQVILTHTLKQELGNFFEKRQVVNILDFANYMLSVAATQFCYCSAKSVLHYI